jgi:hypothetical protein
LKGKIIAQTRSRLAIEMISVMAEKSAQLSEGTEFLRAYC